jgi:hypothetical protein
VKGNVIESQSTNDSKQGSYSNSEKGKNKINIIKNLAKNL